ncbi:ankyrin repeat-containing domain protein [Aspergillus multicolor]|uniref:ankyrin repeat domain-containing protein n=1 Tax=Aspergillus multicolor TaxID=41759 RepID=UPI003CCCBB41
MPLASLPNELILAIGELADSQADLVSFSRTSRRHHDLLERLLISYNIKHNRGNGFHWAVSHNDFELAKRFLARPGLDMNSPALERKKIQPNINLSTLARFDHKGLFDPPLFVAINKDHTEMALLLLNNGATPEVKNGRGTDNAVDLAIAKGYRDIVRKMLDLGIDALKFVPTHSPDYAELCHLSRTIWAVQYNQPSVLQLLLDDIANRHPKLLAKYHNDALVAAAWKGQTYTMALLLDRGAPVDGVPGQRDLPISIAVIQNQADAVELLLERGSDLSLHRQEVSMAFRRHWKRIGRHDAWAGNPIRREMRNNRLARVLLRGARKFPEPFAARFQRRLHASIL